LSENYRVTIEIQAVAIVLSIIAFFLGATLKPPPINKALVVALGDSITYGIGAENGSNYTNLLAKDLGVRVINAGAIRDTTATALLRLDRDVLSQNPDVVIVFLGGNDFLNGVLPLEMEKNLKNIVQKIQGNDAKVIIVGISYQFISDYEHIFEKVAREMNVAGYVPNVLSGILLRPDLMADNLHPNSAGHQIIEQRIRPILEKVLREL